MVTVCRKGIDSGVLVALSSGYHLAIAVVCPDFDDILRDFKVPVTVKCHDLAVEVSAADGILVVLFNQVVLHAHDAAHELSTGFWCVISWVVCPEGLISLASKAYVPYHFTL